MGLAFLVVSDMPCGCVPDFTLSGSGVGGVDAAVLWGRDGAGSDVVGGGEGGVLVIQVLSCMTRILLEWEVEPLGSS